jgi:hypothetical protein
MVFIKKHKRYLIASGMVWGVCLVLLIISYLLVISPQNVQKKHIESELEQFIQKYEFAQKAAQEETRNRLHTEIELLQDKVKNFVLDSKGAEDLTFDISQIANENKVRSFSVESEDVRAASGMADSNNISESHITVSFTAGFNEFAGFLNSLERHRPVLFISEFTLVRAKKDDLTYHVTMDVAAFVRRKQVTKVIDKSFGDILDSQI